MSSNFFINKSLLPTWHTSYATTGTIDIDDVLIDDSNLTDSGTAQNRFIDKNVDASTKYYTPDIPNYGWMYQLDDSYLCSDVQMGVISKSAPRCVKTINASYYELTTPGSYELAWNSTSKDVTIDGTAINANTPVLYIYLCAGGGGGGGGHRQVAGTNYGGGGGGGGGQVGCIVDLTKTGTITIKIGEGGKGGPGGASNGSSAQVGYWGGDTTLTMSGGTVTAHGGRGGGGGKKGSGGTGGSGGSATVPSITGVWKIYTATGGNGGNGAAVGDYGSAGGDCTTPAHAFSAWNMYSESTMSGGNPKGSNNNAGAGGGGASFSVGASRASTTTPGFGHGGAGEGNVGASGDVPGGVAGGGRVSLNWYT